MPVYTIGDTHGDWETLLRKAESLGERGTTLILLGDANMGEPWQTPAALAALEQRLAAIDCALWVLRGNHDNPAPFRDPAYAADFPHLRLLADFEEIRIGGEVGLVVGGAVSVDRRRRRNTYWPDEGVDAAAYARLPKRHYDFVLAHSSPRPPVPLGTSVAQCAFANGDATLCGDVAEEQELLERMAAELTPARWYAGHWHCHCTFTHTAPNGHRTEVRVHEIQELQPF